MRRTLKDRGVAFRISKTLPAPLAFAFEWCTDFREDDPSLAGSTATRHIVEKGPTKTVWISSQDRGGERRQAAGIITVQPPDSWQIESFAKDENVVTKYHLTPLKNGQTKFDLAIRITYKGAHQTPTKKERLTNTRNLWDRYAAALERDYRMANPEARVA
jgi:hypothetical protein